MNSFGLDHLGKLILTLGLSLVGLGVILWLLGRFGLPRLPGDILIRGERFVFYFPIVTCLALSALLTLLFWFLRWLR